MRISKDEENAGTLRAGQSWSLICSACGDRSGFSTLKEQMILE
jgi:hypothetical protein